MESGKKLGFVYAGQGSQFVGMGKDFYEKEPVFAQAFDQAAELVRSETDFDLKKCCFEGPEQQLGSTRYTQPCMTAFAVGITELLKARGITPDVTLGLSLGEYGALYGAGVLTKEELLPLIAYRGKVMEEVVQGREVKMAAILKMDAETIEQTCLVAQDRINAELAQQDTSGSYSYFADQVPLVVEVANYNCPGQIVISGDTKAVDLACEMLREKGAKRIIPLAVSGPFHTSLMKPAGDKLRDKLDQTVFHPAQAMVIHNLTAREKQGNESYQELLEKQVQSSVRLEESIRYLAMSGVDKVIEIGPGDTISKFIRKTVPELACISISKWEDLKNE